MKYIIFDMDGVLVNSEPVIMQAAADALKSGGIKGGREDVGTWSLSLRFPKGG